MPRAMWRGAIQFGLVTIPVRLYLATESRGGLSFNLLHAEDGQRIQMKVHCPEHGEISRADTVRGYEWAKGRYVVIEERDLESVPLRTVRAIEIEQFVSARSARQETVFVRQSYYLEPEAIGVKAFELLRAVLAERQLQAVCKIVLKDREQLAALDPHGPTLLLSTLYWPDEVRDVGELDLPEEQPDFKPAELEMARQLVDALTGEFDASRFRDEYREALLAVIEAKVAGNPIDAPAPTAESSKLTDLMAILEASVAAARAEAATEGGQATTAAAQPAASEAPVSVAAAREGRKGKGTPASRQRSERGTTSAAAADSARARRRKSA